MGTVVEEDIPKDFLAGQQSTLVAFEAGHIVDFGPGIGAVGAGEIAHDHGYSFFFLLDFRVDTGRNMTFHAGYFFMRRGLPGIVVGDVLLFFPLLFLTKKTSFNRTLEFCDDQFFFSCNKMHPGYIAEPTKYH